MLFDIDGTIIDTSEFVFGAVEYTLNKHKLTASQESLAQAMGKPLKDYYKILFPEKDHILLAKTHHDFQQDKFHLGKLFPNAGNILKELKSKGFKIAAVSNRSKGSLTKALKVARIYKFFDVIVSAEDVVNAKPHKDHPAKALELLEVSEKEAIMVGDTENDMLAGKAASIKTVGVSYGWMGNDIKNHKPDFVINSIDQLMNVLK